MADLYVRSTTGNNANSGADWANAKATLGGAAAIAVAGDRIFVSQAHSELTTGAALSVTLSGSITSPILVLCVDDSSTPPTTLAKTGLLRATGIPAQGPSVLLTGGFYLYGLQLKGDSGVIIGTNTNNHFLLEDALFEMGANTSGLTLGTSNFYVQHHFKNCDIYFNLTTQSTLFRSKLTRWEGGKLMPGSQTPANGLFSVGNDRSMLFVDGFDFANASTGFNLLSSLTSTSSEYVFRNCKLPAGWTGVPFTGSWDQGGGVSLYNCDSGDTNYAIWIMNYQGTLRQETAVVRTSGASDGVTNLSWKIVSNTRAKFPFSFKSPEIVRWQETVGAPITVKVEVITDGVTLNTDDCWLEVQYLGTNGTPLSLFQKNRRLPVVAAAAQPTSTDAWTTTGLTTPTKQKLEVTFTPQEKGFIHAVVHVGKPSTTVYVDPKLTVA